MLHMCMYGTSFIPASCRHLYEHVASLSESTPTHMLEGEQGLNFPPGKLSEQDITPPPSRGTVDAIIDTVPVDRSQADDSATADGSTIMATPAEAADASEKERALTASSDHGIERAQDQPESLLCMPAPPISPPCSQVVEWACVQAILRRCLRTYDPLVIDAAVGSIKIDRNKVASGTINEVTFSEVVGAVYKGASDLETADEFAMLMSGAVDLDPASGLDPGLRKHIKNISLYGRIAGATVAWVLQQIEIEDCSEVIGMHSSTAVGTDV